MLHPRTISAPELDNIRRLGCPQGTKDTFGRDPDPSEKVDVPSDKAKQNLAEWVKTLGIRINKEVEPEFVNNPSAKFIACCAMNSTDPVMPFNLAFLPEHLFEGQGQPQLELVIHELAHSDNDAETSHGPKWGKACAKVGVALESANKAIPADNQKKRPWPVRLLYHHNKSTPPTPPHLSLFK